MRLGADIVQAMRERIEPLDTEETRAAYREGRFPRAELVQDLDTRYRWDLFHATKCRELVGLGEVTSAHIDTALRRIVPKLSGMVAA